jgi:homopolymeric O-antigen transport system ATP-binding protein
MAALVFDRVTKEYRGANTYRALRDDVSALLRLRREPRPVVRALDDVSLEIGEGESFGLIGPNGAGKTTALKLATRITYPTRGQVRVRGRVGALIEVGTGLHPELTGRENIGLYGRILGFSGAEIARRFDEVVEFAGIGAAIDQPVKQYSSGMTLRLGFSLAAHLEPDVLLVDEALSIGDSSFHFRCAEKMRDIVGGGGTLVLVSHDMGAIEALCERAVLIDHGRIAIDGDAEEVVAGYMRLVGEGRLTRSGSTAEGDDFELVRISVHDASGAEVDVVRLDEPVTVRVHYRVPRPIPRPSFSIGIGDGRAQPLGGASMLVDGPLDLTIEGEGHVDCTFEELPLHPQVYELWCGVRGEAGFGNLLMFQRVRTLRVEGAAGDGPASSWGARVPVRIRHSWSANGRG